MCVTAYMLWESCQENVIYFFYFTVYRHILFQRGIEIQIGSGKFVPPTGGILAVKIQKGGPV